MRDRVHNHLSIPRPNWVEDIQYLQMMDLGFLKRQEWILDKDEDEEDEDEEDE
jgi:hypothetical protein